MVLWGPLRIVISQGKGLIYRKMWVFMDLTASAAHP